MTFSHMVLVPAGSVARRPGVPMKGFDVEYFFYCRDRPGSMAMRWELAEEHWSFTDPVCRSHDCAGPHDGR